MSTTSCLLHRFLGGILRRGGGLCAWIARHHCNVMLCMCIKNIVFQSRSVFFSFPNSALFNPYPPYGGYLLNNETVGAFQVCGDINTLLILKS